MRYFSKLAIIALAPLSLLALNATAADQNTYRAGSAYLKTVANHYGQCEQQCRGDAACRSWNFVRPNAGSASGICEFNSRMATPVSSLVSMSGTIDNAIDPMMSRAVSAGTRTIRVGTPAAPKPQTIVKRMPVPKQRLTRQTNYSRPAAPQTNHAQRVYGSAKQVTNAQRPAKTPQAQPQQQPQPQTQQRLTPQQAYYRQQYLMEKQRQTEMQRQQYAARQMPPQQRPTQQQPMPYPQAPVQAPAQRPVQRPVQRPMAPQQQHMQPQSLYGSLHDDLTQNMTAVPRPRTAPDNMTNPDAPMATSRAVPSVPVQTAPIQTAPMGPPVSGLAGG